MFCVFWWFIVSYLASALTAATYRTRRRYYISETSRSRVVPVAALTHFTNSNSAQQQLFQLVPYRLRPKAKHFRRAVAKNHHGLLLFTLLGGNFFQNILKKDAKRKGKSVPTARNVGSIKVPFSPSAPTMAVAVDKPRRPRIIKPKKKHNYRNLIPSYTLVPLSFGTNEIGPVQPEISKNTTPHRKAWKQIPSSLPARPDKEATTHFPPLSVVCPREEVPNTSQTRDDSAISLWRNTTLTVDTEIGNSVQQNTSSTLSADAKVFTMPPKLNPCSPPWSPSLISVDPWGNTIHRDILFSPNDASQTPTEPQPILKYSPTTPTPFFPTPTSYSFSPISFFDESNWSHNSPGYFDYYDPPKPPVMTIITSRTTPSLMTPPQTHPFLTLPTPPSSQARTRLPLK